MCDYMCDYIVYYHTFKASCSYKPRSKHVAFIMLCFDVRHHVCEYRVNFGAAVLLKSDPINSQPTSNS